MVSKNFEEESIEEVGRDKKYLKSKDGGIEAEPSSSNFISFLIFRISSVFFSLKFSGPPFLRSPLRRPNLLQATEEEISFPVAMKLIVME